MLPRLWLLVGSDRQTDRQCHLLSCPGQLKTNLYDFALGQILGTLGQVAYLGAGAPQDAAAAAVCRVCQFLCSRSLPSRARKSWSQICCLNYILFASITITLHKFGNISSRRILITGKINILCIKMIIAKATSGPQRHYWCCWWLHGRV